MTTPNPLPIPGLLVDGQGNLTTPFVNYFNTTSEQIAALTPTVVSYELGAGLNTLTPVELGLPDPPSGLLILLLLQPGGSTIAWSSDFFGTPPTGISSTAGTVSAFLFIGVDGAWVLIASSVVSGGGGSGSVLSLDLTLSAAVNVTTADPTFTAGSIIVVRLVQDGAGGHAVTWGANFKFTDVVPPVANTVSLFMFFGASSGVWESCALPILGRHI